jgi:hypothetical protein
MQQYDARGHPVNPESKALARELRRAKNDILSTMGIVVSGEDRNASPSDEQQKINQIAAENDFGLVITTFDQIFALFGIWWSSSLTGRIQVRSKMLAFRFVAANMNIFHLDIQALCPRGSA